MKRLAFFTDLHLDEDFTFGQGVDPKMNFETVLADIAKRNMDCVIFGGDIGAPSAHAYFFDKLKGVSFMFVLGNHDSFKQLAMYCKEGVAKDAYYYRFEYAGHCPLFLDSASGSVSEVQLKWLEQQLRSVPKALLFIHHPVLEVDTAADGLFNLVNRAVVKSVLVESGKNIILFCGHYHTSDECSLGNIRQITTQATCFQLVKGTDAVEVDASSFGYRIINIGKDEISTQLVTFSGKDVRGSEGPISVNKI